MAHCCSQCSFTAQFESALLMHRQLHHGDNVLDCPDMSKLNVIADNEKSSYLPRLSKSYLTSKESKIFKLPGRTSSATKLFDKLRARICKVKSMAAHPEENLNCSLNVNDTSILSEGTSKAYHESSPLSRSSVLTTRIRSPTKETYGCHLCSFIADRITVLDRHLLNDHKIGLENLLKLVMAKTKEGLSEHDTNANIYGVRQPYYRPPDEMIQEGEFVIETVTPKIKILKHASSNTETQWTDIPNLKDNCRIISKELEKLINCPIEKCDKNDFMAKMQILNECMCKFVDSSNTLKKALTKEFDSKHNVRDNLSFNLSLADRDTPRGWEKEKAHSEKMEKSRNKYSENCRGDKKYSAESFYF